MKLRNIRRKFYSAFRVETGIYGLEFWIIQPSKWGIYHGQRGSLPS